MINKIILQEIFLQIELSEDFDICPNILHVDANAAIKAEGIAIALLHSSAVMLKANEHVLNCIWNGSQHHISQCPLLWNTTAKDCHLSWINTDYVAAFSSCSYY